MRSLVTLTIAISLESGGHRVECGTCLEGREWRYIKNTLSKKSGYKGEDTPEAEAE